MATGATRMDGYVTATGGQVPPADGGWTPTDAFSRVVSFIESVVNIAIRGAIG
ncbi:MAG: hypothetical protein IT305_06690 [Chloroflexi bacterium]|nr:hypothetical protein [Chloroflexota bacterium]